MRKHPAWYPAVYRFHLLFIGLLVFLLHGAKLNSDVIGIDTEDIIHLRDGFYGGWLHTGRQGLVLLKYLWGNGRFNPYFAGLMTLVLFAASVAAFFLLWDRAGGLSGGRGRRCGRAGLWAWGLGGLLWISHPVMAEQFYFSLQSMEICACMFLTALAVYLSYCWADGHRLLTAAGSVLILVLTFSSYQIFVVIYIFGVVSVLLIQALGDIRAGGCSGKTDVSADTDGAVSVEGIESAVGTADAEGAASAPGAAGSGELTAGCLLRRVVPYLVIFLAAFVLNTIITQLFFSSSGYLRNQIFWGAAPVKDCIFAIGAHVVKVFTGVHSVFYQAGFGILAALDFGLLIRFLRGFGRGRRGILWVAVFFYLSLLAVPFLMTLLLGGAPAARSQLALPAVTGFLGYLGIWLGENGAVSRTDAGARMPREAEESGADGAGAGVRRRADAEESGEDAMDAGTAVCPRCEIRRMWAAILAAAVCLVSGMEQAKVTECLYYTDSCRYEQDAAMGRALIQRVRQVSLGDDGVPLIVVGHRSFIGNNACVMGEVIGRSFFDYDTEVEPVSFWSTRRVLGFLHTLGAEFRQAPEERIGEALEYSTYMPEWPAEDSVQEKDGMIIIKLSHYE